MDKKRLESHTIKNVKYKEESGLIFLMLEVNEFNFQSNSELFYDVTGDEILVVIKNKAFILFSEKFKLTNKAISKKLADQKVCEIVIKHGEELLKGKFLNRGLFT